MFILHVLATCRQCVHWKLSGTMAVVATIAGMSLTEFSGCINDVQGQLYMHKYTLQCELCGMNWKLYKRCMCDKRKLVHLHLHTSIMLVPMGLADWGEQTAWPQHRLSQMPAVSVRMPAAMLDIEGGVGNICSHIASTTCCKLATSPSVTANLSFASSTFHSILACFSLKQTTSSLRSCTLDVFVLSPGVVGGFVPLLAAVDDGLAILNVFPSHAGVWSVPHQKLDGIWIEIILNGLNNEWLTWFPGWIGWCQGLPLAFWMLWLSRVECWRCRWWALMWCRFPRGLWPWPGPHSDCCHHAASDPDS